MHRFYNLPGGAAAGIADSKLPNMQAGWEQATSNVMAGLAGLNLVYESVGMHASLLGFCLESMVLGDDLLGQALRCVKGIEITDSSLSFQTMKEICLNGTRSLPRSQSDLKFDANRIYLPKFRR